MTADQNLSSSASSADDSIAIRLESAAQQWLAESAGEAVPAETVCMVVQCGACARAWTPAFRFAASPSFGDSLDAPFADLATAWETLEGLGAGRRHSAIDEDDWDASLRCECRAPTHHSRILVAALLRAMLGSGAALLLGVTRDRAARARPFAARLPIGGTARALDEPTSAAIERAFERPFTLFEPWSDLKAHRGAGAYLVREPEPGVRLVLAPSAARLRAAVAHELGARLFVAVAIEAATVRASWPASLHELAEQLDREAGWRAAIAVDRDILLRSVQANAWTHLGAEVVRVDEATAELVRGELRWPVPLTDVPLSMARWGRTLGEASARAVAVAQRSVDRASALVGAMTAARPGLEFQIEGSIAIPLRANGTAGRSFDLVQLARSLPDEELEREIAFLCDDLPAWADATRTCPCGAPATLQLRLVSELFARRFESRTGGRLWEVERWDAEPPAHAALEVVALACDRHVRLLAQTELMRLGLRSDTLADRLAADIPLAHLRVAPEIREDERGARALLVRGNMAAGLLLRDAWMSALNASLGMPLRDREVEACAFAPHAFCLAEVACSPRLRARLVTELRANGGDSREAPEPFFVRRSVDLSTPPQGRVDIVAPDRVHDRIGAEG